MSTVIITPTGFKTTPKGRVINTPDKVAEFLGSIPKPFARRVRKQLHAEGRLYFASIPARRAA